MGVSRRQIAVYRRTSEVALDDVLGAELEQAEIEAIRKVVQALFTMATRQNSVAAAIFWMKARGGWQDRQQIEVAGKGDGPVEASHQYQRLIRGIAP